MRQGVNFSSICNFSGCRMGVLFFQNQHLGLLRLRPLLMLPICK